MAENPEDILQGSYRAINKIDKIQARHKRQQEFWLIVSWSRLLLGVFLYLWPLAFAFCWVISVSIRKLGGESDFTPSVGMLWFCATSLIAAEMLLWKKKKE